jgi:L-fuconolactonase
MAPLERVAELAKRLPKLRIVVDHMANPTLRAEPDDAWREWKRLIAGFERLPNVACKVSGLVEAASRGSAGRGSAGRGSDRPFASPTDVAFYAPTLDHLFDVFGEDRVIYGSNWPVCEVGGSLFAVQKLATDYFTTKGDAVLRKYLAGNARTFYKWVDRKRA